MKPMFVHARGVQQRTLGVVEGRQRLRVKIKQARASSHGVGKSRP
jgi:hypothetical protein